LDARTTNNQTINAEYNDAFDGVETPVNQLGMDFGAMPMSFLQPIEAVTQLYI
jgi:hypothetical protein